MGIRAEAAAGAVLILAALLSGCGIVPVLPGREPFGEVTSSEDQAREVYETFSQRLRQEAPEDWEGWSLSWSEAGWDIDIYRTQAYTLAFCEAHGGVDYLWYDGWLYWNSHGTVCYRAMDWAELGTEDFAAQLWRMSQELLDRTPDELTYQYIPMASGNQHLLKARYVLKEEEPGDYGDLSAYLSGGGDYDTVNFTWQDVGDLDQGVGRNNVCAHILFFPFDGSTDLQAERKLWSFGYGCGLSERNIPAISVQQDDRAGCQAVIAAMDFAALRDRAVYQDTLAFPGLPFHIGETSGGPGAP